MDLILDDHGSFIFVPGPAAGPVLSADAERTTLDQPCPVHGSTTVSSKPQEQSAESEDLCSPLDLCAAAAPTWNLTPAAWAYLSSPPPNWVTAAARHGWWPWPLRCASELQPPQSNRGEVERSEERYRSSPPPAAAQWIHVMDRGADDFEVHRRVQRIGADWIGRVKSRHRRVRDQAGAECALSDALARSPVEGGYTLELRTRPRQPKRRAKIEVSFAAVTVLVPRQPASSLKALAPQPIAQWAVWAHEVDPPAGLKEPIDWVLLTSLPVRTLEEAMEVISYYEKRWLIEEWHKALKTGCQVERRQLGTSEGLEALTGLLSVVAVRLLQLKEVGRREPKRAATELVPARYVELVHRARRGRGDAGQWTIRDFFRGVAGLGGFLGRKGDGEPGWITVWRGWEVLHWMLSGAELASQPPS